MIEGVDYLQPTLWDDGRPWWVDMGPICWEHARREPCGDCQRRAVRASGDLVRTWNDIPGRSLSAWLRERYRDEL